MHMFFKKLFVIAASALAALALVASPAFADSRHINFEQPTYQVGSINNQDGWSATGPFDQAVVTNTHAAPRGFGAQSFRMSNAVTSGTFGDQVFARPLLNAAGESSATAGAFPVGVRQTNFNVQWTFASAVPTRQQPGLALSVSPDRGDGSRMSYIRLVDEVAGIGVYFDDVQDKDPVVTTQANFVETKVASGLNRARPHTVRLDMQFVAGPSNDVVKVFIDGDLVHTGTSWEDYYRFDPEAKAEQSPRLVRTVLFRAGGTANVANSGNGFLFDKLTLTSLTPRDTNDEGND